MGILYFEPRHVHGGHTRASRGEFVFAALGRVWATTAGREPH
jgi:hypothetical protein